MKRNIFIIIFTLLLFYSSGTMGQTFLVKGTVRSELAFEGFRRDDLRRWKIAETVLPQAIKGVRFVGTVYQQRYPDLQVDVDIQVDDNGFIVAESAASRQFLPKHYLDPIPLQQIQLTKGSLTQNPGW